MAGIPIPPLIYPFANPNYRTITQPFGPRPYPSVEPLLGGVPFHRGVDFAVPSEPVDTPLLAVASGVIQWAALDKYGDKFNGGYGLMVGIMLDGTQGRVAVLYAHMNRVDVAVGDHVTQGQQIGLSGGQGPPGVGTTSGNSTGAHLHFGLNTYGSVFNDVGWTDPIPYLGDVSAHVAYPIGGPNAAAGPNAGSGGAVAPGYISAAQAVYYARKAHIPESQLATCVAIAIAESGLQIAITSPVNSDGSRDYGLWQISVSPTKHTQYDIKRLTSDPAYNAAAMYDISSGGTIWHPWTTYWAVGNPPRGVGDGKGAYRANLQTAEDAVNGTPATDQFPQTPGPGTPSAPMEPELPVDRAVLVKVVVDKSALVYREGAGLTPTAGLQILDEVLPIAGCTFTDPAYLSAGTFSADLSLAAFDTPSGKRVLDALFQKTKTQATIRMGYVPRTNTPDPRTVPPVFVGLATVPEVNYAQGTVRIAGGDMSALVSQTGDTASRIDTIQNTNVGDAIKQIVKRYDQRGVIDFQIDVTAGTVGGLMGPDAVQGRTAVRTAWDLIVQLSDGEGAVAFFVGTTLIVRRIPPDGAAVRLGPHEPGVNRLVQRPRFRPQPHAKRDFYIKVFSYDTKGGALRPAHAGNPDSPDVVELFRPPNWSQRDLDNFANAKLSQYQATELQADIQLGAPLLIAPNQPIILDLGATGPGERTHAMDPYVAGDKHPYYAVRQTTTYSPQAGITLALVATNRQPGILGANQAQAAGV